MIVIRIHRLSRWCFFAFGVNSLTRPFFTSSGFRGINRRLCVIDRFSMNTRKALQRQYSGVTRHYAKLKTAKKKPNPNSNFVVRFRF